MAKYESRKIYKLFAVAVGAKLNCLKSGKTEWNEVWMDRIDDLVKNWLPRGAGYDNGTTLDLDKSTGEKLVFNTSFHHMNSNGYYTHWSDYTIIVTPSLVNGFNLTIKGRNINGIKDMMHDDFSNALSHKGLFFDERIENAEMEE